MGQIAAFVDAIYKRFDDLILDIEEDQKLPERETIKEVCQTLLDVSCMREEGRFPSFRVCFIQPDSELLGAYIYAHTLLFQKPVSFQTDALHKLAPALNANMSYLMVDIRERPFKATGIIAAYTTWERVLTGELSSGARLPRIPNILVNGPGEVRACFGEAPIVTYSSGKCIFSRTDAFTSSLVADELRKDSAVSEKERLQLLYRILWHMINYRHGGTILIAPSADSCEKYIDLKYSLPTRFLFEDEDEPLEPFGKARAKEIVTYADLLAKLTAVDGAVVLTKDLGLLGFGCEILVDEMEKMPPALRFVGTEPRPSAPPAQQRQDDPEKARRIPSGRDAEESAARFRAFGMRHRAAYRFCSAVEGSVAIVISQDGEIQACTKSGDKVVVYSHIALPLF